jgi:hypothetical protein
MPEVSGPKSDTVVFDAHYFTASKEKGEDSFDVYKEYARWIVRTEHLFISWYAVPDVGL